MRVLDLFGGAAKKSQELGTLGGLYNRLQRHIGNAEERRNELCRSAVASAFSLTGADSHGSVDRAAYQLCQMLLAFEGHLYLPAIETNKPLTMGQTWEVIAIIKRALVPFEEREKRELITASFIMLIKRLTNGLPQIIVPAGDSWASLSTPLYVLLPDLADAIESITRMSFTEELVRTGFFERLRGRLEYNICIASGIDPARQQESRRAILMPNKVDMTPEELVTTYLDGTPFVDFLQTPLPFFIPLQARFEHMHIVGGSGHGKTQLLQHLILHDLEKLAEGKGSIVVIDSQGDMIQTITHSAGFAPSAYGSFSDRLVLIDPNDIEYPPCLNLLDFGLERLERYGCVERERLINGAIALYEYLFGALLGADLTQRQGVIFRFLARLMMTVPGATIHTFMQFMEEPEATRPHLSKLDPVSRRFFETQFSQRLLILRVKSSSAIT